MGFSRQVYESVGGFRGSFGEDIDMSTRIHNAGFTVHLIPEAFVYHKRRLSWRSFFWQVYVFGMTRVELHRLHPDSLKLVHLLPVCFLIGLLGMIVTAVVWNLWALCPFGLYALALLLDAWIANRSLLVAFLSVIAAFIQLTGYGAGFLSAFFRRFLLRQVIDAQKEFGKRYEKRK
jgi:GT2 family glycosyltransferase